jgi:hypothetical protein
MPARVWTLRAAAPRWCGSLTVSRCLVHIVLRLQTDAGIEGGQRPRHRALGYPHQVARPPVRKLIRGFRDGVPCYASWRVETRDDLDKVARSAERHVSDGFRAMTCHLGRLCRRPRAQGTRLAGDVGFVGTSSYNAFADQGNRDRLPVGRRTGAGRPCRWPARPRRLVNNSPLGRREMCHRRTEWTPPQCATTAPSSVGA